MSANKIMNENDAEIYWRKKRYSFKLNNHPIEHYSFNDCVASIRAAWSWGYFKSASIDNEAVDAEFLSKIGCGP